MVCNNAVVDKFLAPARPGERLVAEGRVVRRGKHVAHLAGEIKVGDRLIATATGTWAIWSSAHLHSMDNVVNKNEKSPTKDLNP